MSKGLPKSEIIHKRDEIQSLLKKGESFAHHPVRAIYEIHPSENPGVTVMFSVPKRKFKHAVDRNRIKRLLREGYRLNKQNLTENVKKHQLTVRVMFLFTGRELPEFTRLQDKIILTLQRLEQCCESFVDQES